jgi:hypothetical protein
MSIKSLTNLNELLSTLIGMATGLVVTLTFLGSLISESIRENVIGFTQTLIANGPMGMFILFFVLCISLDNSWRLYYSMYKAKGINRQWVSMIQNKYTYQKWLKPIYVIFGGVIIFNWIL